ncbi:unnamed protein product [Closterium sp. NIES-53]
MGRVSRPGPVRQQSSLPQYLRRIVKWQQMDAEYCFWQMLHLCLTPRVVTTNVSAILPLSPPALRPHTLRPTALRPPAFIPPVPLSCPSTSCSSSPAPRASRFILSVRPIPPVPPHVRSCPPCPSMSPPSRVPHGSPVPSYASHASHAVHPSRYALPALPSLPRCVSPLSPRYFSHLDAPLPLSPLSPLSPFRPVRRAETKNQWARDDPAFVVISAMLLAISASSYCIAYGHGIAQAGLTVFSVVVFDFLLIGAAIATLCWFVCNRYLRETGGVASHAVCVQPVFEGHWGRGVTCSGAEGRVVRQRAGDMLYAFDVHCNAYFPLFVLLYVVQYFLSPLLLAPGFIPLLLSNTLYLVAFSYYHYLNFLGYDVLPFLDKTTVLLYPMPLLLLLFPISLLSRFNPTQFALSYYFS